MKIKSSLACLSAAMMAISCITYADDLPDWMIMPPQNGGFSGSGCAPLAGNVMMARDVATLQARSSIASQVKTGVENVARMQSATDGRKSSTQYEAFTEQTANEVLRNSRVTKFQQIKMDGKKQLCVLVEVSETDAAVAFDSLMVASNDTPADKKALLRAFTGSTQ